jgi:hypothetical protein
MDFIDLVSVMGEPLDNPALQAHLRAEKISAQPRPAEGEDMAFVQFAAKGYEMRFDLKPGSPQLVLKSITAYVQGDATHRPFTGRLPLDIDPKENRTALLARLGPPALHNKIFKIDMWKLGKWDVAVDYDKASGAVASVQVNVPRK